MASNKYVDFVSDEHFVNCIENLYNSYKKARSKISKAKFYKNKIDTIKLTFDSKFNNLSEEELIKTEISRQIDKSVNNAIGTFHEQILGGVEGYEVGNLSGFDIKANDNSLFAEIKNKHNTMSSSASESAFQRLARFADDYRSAECYLVQIWAKSSFVKKWAGIINGKEYSHSRVNIISGDKFYALITKREDALFELYKSLPNAIDDFLKTVDIVDSEEYDLINTISKGVEESEGRLLNIITYDNFAYYLGFDNL